MNPLNYDELRWHNFIAHGVSGRSLRLFSIDLININQKFIVFMAQVNSSFCN